MEVELRGIDANGGACYIGTGCFHRRESLLGKKYREATKVDWSNNRHTKTEESIDVLEETSKPLASCDYEENTQWGKEVPLSLSLSLSLDNHIIFYSIRLQQVANYGTVHYMGYTRKIRTILCRVAMGLMYGCPVEDILTGLVIHCRGWRSVCFSPQRKGFLGAAPTTLLQTLVQHKRWTDGDLQIFLSRYCPLLLGYKKIPLRHQLSYLPYLLWAANCLPLLYYAIAPSLCLLRGISLFPQAKCHKLIMVILFQQMSNLWAVPFIYVFVGNRVYSLVELLSCGGTFQEWLNDQRMWLFKRATSYFFAFFENILKLVGFTKSAFALTAKVADDDVSKRYEQELIEFGTTSPMFTILTTLAVLNAIGFCWGLKMLILGEPSLVLNPFALQAILCGLWVFINLPIYQAIFLRTDKGKMPASVTCQSIMFALVACSIALY
ncbi:hypothetical protein TIFTF001_054621 [Ficus carica]|uniref:Cellulose synthase-like protein E6 n=1 Tax=Ficus carica TaxID=3494 RepID=A0AA88EBF9_FICCA|nr:hypothetical protein TIFTF001_054619 [Ficus carica]GMN71619.1 hypothetical protein TIFTF001_054621 [Ficus carica]